jgi:hypothetical protein
MFPNGSALLVIAGFSVVVVLLVSLLVLMLRPRPTTESGVLQRLEALESGYRLLKIEWEDAADKLDRRRAALARERGHMARQRPELEQSLDESPEVEPNGAVQETPAATPAAPPMPVDRMQLLTTLKR